METKMLLSISEAAAVLGISRPSIYRLIHADDGFPIIRVGGRVLIPSRAGHLPPINLPADSC